MVTIINRGYGLGKKHKITCSRYVTTNQTFQHVKSQSSSSTIYPHLNRDIIQLNRPPPNKNIPGNKKNRSTNTAPRHRHRTQYPHQVQTKPNKSNRTLLHPMVPNSVYLIQLISQTSSVQKKGIYLLYVIVLLLSNALEMYKWLLRKQ